MKNRLLTAAVGALLVLSWGSAEAAPRRAKGADTVYRDTTSPDGVKGVGTESQDIVSMSDAMVRDLLSVPELMNRPTPPRIIVDPKYFRNESSEIIDKALITDRIRVNLIRSAQGRMRFVGREYAGAVEEERELKDAGKVDVGTTGRTRPVRTIAWSAGSGRGTPSIRGPEPSPGSRSIPSSFSTWSTARSSGRTSTSSRKRTATTWSTARSRRCRSPPSTLSSAASPWPAAP